MNDEFIVDFSTILNKQIKFKTIERDILLRIEQIESIFSQKTLH